MTAAFDPTIRRLRNLWRPSAAANAARLRARGEQVASLTIRDALSADVPALARLHVATWNATHRGGRSGRPSYELRDKIYLLEEYQRLGLGRRLVGHVVRRFLSQEIDSMVLFGDARNPSCACWAALGGEPLPHPDGTFSGSYGWRDLRRLAATCAPD